ncbi:MAG: hypothetical protein COV48_07170 [Elusimicrobia bacterium CG11_big_fil_rev_8_21_14_0_20_64_6]|nr:MAG: hypothetical protein COV48_07170 [Elusimicrobia bacterium CG11_big_fil_rev_8_21_14_0_20_64_6]
MKKTLLVLVALAAATTLRAQSFETQIVDSLRPFIVEDAFSDLGACGVLDIKTIRPFALEEAADLVKPCIDAFAQKYDAKALTEPGFLSAPQSGLPGKTGLLIKTDLTAGSRAHRELVAAISRREGRLLGHLAKVMTKDETAPASISTLQHAIDGCMLLTVVRDIRSGEDFVKIYGKCLTRNPDLKIQEIRAAEGLAVTVKTAASNAQVEAYNGFVTVNAGKGEVKVMVVAYGSQVFLP